MHHPRAENGVVTEHDVRLLLEILKYEILVAV